METACKKSKDFLFIGKHWTRIIAHLKSSGLPMRALLFVNVSYIFLQNRSKRTRAVRTQTSKPIKGTHVHGQNVQTPIAFVHESRRAATGPIFTVSVSSCMIAKIRK